MTCPKHPGNGQLRNTGQACLCSPYPHRLGHPRSYSLGVCAETPRPLSERQGAAGAVCPVPGYFRASAESTGIQAHRSRGRDHLSDPSQLRAGAR